MPPRRADVLLQRAPLSDALARYAHGLRRLTAAAGQPGKYHETITVSFLIAIADRMASTTTTDWDTFRNDQTDLLERDWPLRHYTRNELDGDARSHFRLPNHVPSRRHLAVLRVAFAGLYATGAIAALISSTHTIGATTNDAPLAEFLVGTLELLGAGLFVTSRLRRVGAVLLIGAFTIAEAILISQGGFRITYPLYAVGVLALLAAEPRKWPVKSPESSNDQSRR